MVISPDWSIDWSILAYFLVDWRTGGFLVFWFFGFLVFWFFGFFVQVKIKFTGLAEGRVGRGVFWFFRYLVSSFKSKSNSQASPAAL